MIILATYLTTMVIITGYFTHISILHFLYFIPITISIIPIIVMIDILGIILIPIPGRILLQFHRSWYNPIILLHLSIILILMNNSWHWYCILTIYTIRITILYFIIVILFTGSSLTTSIGYNIVVYLFCGVTSCWLLWAWFVVQSGVGVF